MGMGQETISETIDSSQKNTSVAQKALFYVLCGLFVLMIVFSLMAIKDKGKAGFERCVQEKCAKHGEAFCAKPREVDNCCKGAGGETWVSGSKAECVFE